MAGGVVEINFSLIFCHALALSFLTTKIWKNPTKFDILELEVERITNCQSFVKLFGVQKLGICILSQQGAPTRTIEQRNMLGARIKYYVGGATCWSSYWQSPLIYANSYKNICK